MENLLRAALFLMLVLAAAAVAAGQSWNGSEGSGILRTTPIAIGSPYDRPGIFFLGRPAKMLAPAYAYVYPYGTSRIEIGDGYVVTEFEPLDSRGATASAQVQQRAALRVARNVPHKRGKALTNRMKS